MDYAHLGDTGSLKGFIALNFGKTFIAPALELYKTDNPIRE
jgi:hypothetical protein